MCVLLPSYRHPPMSFPHVLGKEGKAEGVKRHGEGGRRVEIALDNIGYTFAISETPRLLYTVSFGISWLLNKCSN